MAEPVLLGLDLGTTSLAGRLCTASAQPLAESETVNPQRQFGDDVIRRLQAAQAGHAAELQSLLVDGVNQLIGDLLRQAGAVRAQISAAAAAANPAISLLLAGQPTDRILFPPHRPEYRAGALLDSATVGLQLPVPLFLFPLVSGYVGGDLVAGLLAEEAPTGPALHIDLGTNAELALWDGRQWLVTSVAAGPAFEAGHLTCGMRHGPGAIQRVDFSADEIDLDVVAGASPTGVCGSGFFAALSAARGEGLIGRDGRIRTAAEVETPLARYLVDIEQKVWLQLYRDARHRLLLSQEDVRAFQLAKGAVAAGVDCLLQRAGLGAGEIRSVRVAGALGTALPARDLKGVAMLPEIMLDKVRFLPSAVLNGVMVSLLRDGGEERVRKFAAGLKPYPLSGTPAFEQRFLTSLDFV